MVVKLVITHHGHRPQISYNSDDATICAPSLMAVVGQYVHWAGKAGRRMPRLLRYWLMLVVNSLKCNSWTINLD